MIPLLAIGFSFGQTEDKAITKMFADQAAAANRGDVTAYMATIDPASGGYKKTKEEMTQVFSTFKLKFKVESVKVIFVKGNTAQIKTSMVTKMISGPGYRDNRLKMTSNLVKKGGKWLMTTSKINAVEYLD